MVFPASLRAAKGSEAISQCTLRDCFAAKIAARNDKNKSCSHLHYTLIELVRKREKVIRWAILIPAHLVLPFGILQRRLRRCEHRSIRFKH
jgi:hypothetical protein